MEYADFQSYLKYLCPTAGLGHLLDVPGHLSLVLGRDPAEDLVRVWRPPHALALTYHPLRLFRAAKQAKCERVHAGLDLEPPLGIRPTVSGKGATERNHYEQ